MLLSHHQQEHLPPPPRVLSGRQRGDRGRVWASERAERCAHVGHSPSGWEAALKPKHNTRQTLATCSGGFTMPRGRGSYLWCLGSAVTVIKAGASSMASKYSVSSSSSLASPFEDCTLPAGTKGSRCSVAACPLWNPSSTSVTAVPSVLLLLCPLQHRLPSQLISHQPPFSSTRRGCRAGFQLLKPGMCPPVCILPPVEARKAPLPHSEPPPKCHQATQPAPAPASARKSGLG